MPHIPCKICQTIFYAKPFHQRKGWAKYCSRSCQYKAQQKGKLVACEICSNRIWKTPSHFRHSESKKFFCSKSCQTVWRNRVYIGEKHSRWINGINTYRRIIRRSGLSEQCKQCGIIDTRVLIVHHIDHDRTNNNIKNLMWLCRNCHYLIHEGRTF